MKAVNRRYCSENSKHLYDDYYCSQVGSGLPVFTGSQFQRGHGLGSIFSGLLRTAVPILKKGAVALGKQALKSGIGFANDVLQGQKPKKAIQARLKEAGGELLQNATKSFMTPRPPGTPSRAGIKRPAKYRPRTRIPAKHRATSRRDIFD